ncbi:ABC transporter ATP-binding protein [Nocardioides marmoribigeumensis]|jgi:ABC-type lipoprotein export system ATPase subunit|uniref:ABC-type lipoprotein export system ATPase subunit n=1 Tax=Nocardioides marmoribigeumensis TaxID=433649 RepID=A0ABU2BYS6_9ACTN|nr:ABC transporter ATP-binding protein [Nocardioides marmoribigeumensis]MDR7363562.1 ABC-type lipoprotein export system ATPase subunit [Nocardioides marmoribigeumensis]
MSTAATQSRHHPASYGAGAHIVCDNLIRIYRTDKVEVVALQGLDLLVDRGELVAVIGASGSGKSTLLNILSGLDQPTAGLCRVGDQDLLEMSGRQRLRYRRHVVGFVWQQTARNLVPYLSVCDNVLLPLLASRTGRDERHERVEQLLGLLGVADVRDRRPGELSGGQQQRVSIAVALANRPEVLLADEPTGELDSRTAEEVFGALQRVNTELGVTVVVVTHDAGVSEHVGRTVGIRDGRTSSEVLRHDTGHEGLVAQEYAVLDRVGRLQLPQEFTSALQMDRRVRLELEEDHIGVWPDRPAGPEGGAS